MPVEAEASRERFIARVGAFIDRHSLLDTDAAVLVAVSGGADSVALLHALVELAAQPARRYRLHVGHLDHALRSDSADDARFVADLAGALSLPIVAERADVAAAAQPGESLEATARRVRYAFLGRAARRRGCGAIATGHQADDNVETVLHRILRGTGVDGLMGIRPRRPLTGEGGPDLIRPMLDVTRSQAQAFLAARGAAWRTDSTNANVRHTRNRIRGELLPALRERYNPRIDDAIRRLIQAARWADRTLSRVAEQLLADATLQSSPGRVVLAAGKVAALGPADASLVIRAALKHVGAPMGKLGMDHVQRVWSLACRPSGTGRVQLSDGVTADRQYDRLVIGTTPSDPRPPGGPCEVNWPGTTELPDGSALTVTLHAAGDVDLDAFIAGKDACTEMLDAARVAAPVTARRWVEGDRFTPLGAPGRRKLSDFFASARVDADTRRDAWILADTRGILWVAPHRIDHRVRITPQTTQVATVRLLAPPR